MRAGHKAIQGRWHQSLEVADVPALCFVSATMVAITGQIVCGVKWKLHTQHGAHIFDGGAGWLFKAALIVLGPPDMYTSGSM